MSQASVARRIALAVMILLAMFPATNAALAQDATPVASPMAGSQLSDIECPDLGPDIPEDLTPNEDFTCAVLTVPANHDEPDAGQLELFVVLLPSRSENPAPEPIIFLAGGPGQAGTVQLPQFSTELPEELASFAPLLDTHNVVLIDQRGTGLSLPSLACPADIVLAATPAPGATPETQEGQPQTPGDPELALDLYGECDEVLTEAGVDLTLFNTSQNAADIDALREALGVDRANLFGTSYGSWLAQVVMRDYPEGIRSVVIDSPTPLQSNLFGGQAIGFQTALDASQEGCQADPVCALAYPDLDDQLAQVVTSLNAVPLVVTLEDPMSGESAEIPVDGTLFLAVVYQLHFIGPFVPVVAPLIASVAQGEDEVLADLLPIILTAGAGISSGFYYSVICQDEVPFTPLEEVYIDAEAAGVSELVIENSSEPTSTGAYEICAAWDLPASPAIANEPVTSNVPTLIVTGEFDPITPTAYGEQVVATLSNGTLVESGIGGHAPLSSSGECGVAVVISFLTDPTAELDSTCLTNARADFSPDQPAGEGTPAATPAS